MVTRKLKLQQGSILVAIPKALLDVLNLKKGDDVSFGIENGKITIAPTRPIIKKDNPEPICPDCGWKNCKCEGVL